MKTKTRFIKFFLFLFCMTIAESFGQYNDMNPAVVSTAPVKFRVNEANGKTLHGYYSKGYNLTIYGDSTAIGYRADCDTDDDWTGATPGGTTQDENSFETKYKCVFNPHKLYGTVLPGNKTGQNHYDGTQRIGAVVGDITMTFKIDANGKAIDSILGVVFDRGPQTQPGESSVATCKKLKVTNDNNTYLYIIYPNSAKYLEQVIGTKPNSNKLKRNPTNEDVANAFTLLCTQEAANNKNRTDSQKKIVAFLAAEPMKTGFDNATPDEKIKGRSKPGNNDRNANE